MSTEDRQNLFSDTARQIDVDDDEINWVDREDSESIQSPSLSNPNKFQKSFEASTDTVVMVETAFLASAASLVWLINFYFSRFLLFRNNSLQRNY